MSTPTTDIKTASFRFLNVIIRESHLILKSPGEFKINVTITPKGFIDLVKNQFTLDLTFVVKEESDFFEISVAALAFFEFDVDANIEEYKNSYFIKNAPAIVFPYVRAYISSLTAQSGNFTVTLPTFNLEGLAKTLKKNITVIEGQDA